MYQLPPNERIFAVFGYTIVGILTDYITIPVQRLLYKLGGNKWTFLQEGLFTLSLLVISSGIGYTFLKLILLENDPYAHSFQYFFFKNVIPTVFLMLPVMIFLRWIFSDKTT